MLKKILLFGAGKSATVLIDYLLAQAALENWHLLIADTNLEQILSKTNNSAFATAIAIDVNNNTEREHLIQSADIVISMMPPSLHILIARDCITFGKNLLTASYVDDQIKALQPFIENKQLLFIGEMGLDPGIDHMSAMQIIDTIHAEGGSITSFKSHCGGLVAPENDDNPWHYKISWNPRNIVLAGKSGADYKLNNTIFHKDYQQLFNNCEQVYVEDIGMLAAYPNRDSLGYAGLYGINDAATVMRTTLRHPSFCVGWNIIVNAVLTDDKNQLDKNGLSFKNWWAPVLPFVNDENELLLNFLGLADDKLVPAKAHTAADVLQHLLETRLAMQPGDKDMIVMLHEIEFENADGQKQKIESSLIVKGEDASRTAMAKTVGLPLGIAAKLMLKNNIPLIGLHIPIHKEIYIPVLKELNDLGIVFKETNTSTQTSPFG